VAFSIVFHAAVLIIVPILLRPLFPESALHLPPTFELVSAKTVADAERRMAQQAE